MPFEIDPAAFTYFFDCGIVVRGLLSVWRATGEPQYLDAAVATGDSMTRDFAGPLGDFHPILAVPSRTPLARDPLRWSRTASCYQLKSAMAWWDLYEATARSALHRTLRARPRGIPALLRAIFFPAIPIAPK